MNKISMIMAALLGLTLFSCASPPIAKPDLSGSTYASRNVSRRDRIRIKAVEVRDVSNKGEVLHEGSSGFSYTHAPTTVSEPTNQTVAEDIKVYFGSTTTIDATTPLSVFVTIQKADVYEAHKINGTAFIPIIGVFTGNDSKIGMNIKVKVEIERAGKVVKDWTFEKVLERGTHFADSRSANYQSIIRDYRNALFQSVDDEVTRFIYDSELNSPTNPLARNQ